MFPFRKKSLELSPEENPNKSKKERKGKKQAPVVWSAKERLVVFLTLAVTVFASAVLGASAREWKLPGWPRLQLPNLPTNWLERTIIIEGIKSPAAGEVDAQAVIGEFRQLTQNFSGVYGFWVFRLEDQESYGLAQDEVFEAASLIKLPVLIALYQEAEAGHINLDEVYLLQDSDKVGGSGSLSGKPAGTKITWRQLAQAMGHQSDNTAFNIVRKRLGDRLIQETIFKLGLTKTSLAENLTTPKEMGLIFKALWEQEALNSTNSEEVLNFLTDTIYEQHLSAGFPKGTRVAHKYGREVHVVNDGGIVYAPKPFVVVILTKGVVESEADATFPELARLIFAFEQNQ